MTFSSQKMENEDNFIVLDILPNLDLHTARFSNAEIYAIIKYLDPRKPEQIEVQIKSELGFGRFFKNLLENIFKNAPNSGVQESYDAIMAEFFKKHPEWFENPKNGYMFALYRAFTLYGKDEPETFSKIYLECFRLIKPLIPEYNKKVKESLSITHTEFSNEIRREFRRGKISNMKFGRLCLQSSKPDMIINEISGGYLHSEPVIKISDIKKIMYELEMKSYRISFTWISLMILIMAFILLLRFLRTIEINMISLWLFMFIILPISFQFIWDWIEITVYDNPEYSITRRSGKYRIYPKKNLTLFKSGKFYYRYFDRQHFCN